MFPSMVTRSEEAKKTSPVFIMAAPFVATLLLYRSLAHQSSVGEMEKLNSELAMHLGLAVSPLNSELQFVQTKG